MPSSDSESGAGAKASEGPNEDSEMEVTSDDESVERNLGKRKREPLVDPWEPATKRSRFEMLVQKATAGAVEEEEEEEEDEEERERRKRNRRATKRESKALFNEIVAQNRTNARQELAQELRHVKGFIKLGGFALEMLAEEIESMLYEQDENASFQFNKKKSGVIKNIRLLRDHEAICKSLASRKVSLERLLQGEASFRKTV